MILSCQNINKSFVTDDVLKDVSFHLEEREKAALIGPNGAGKSTLLKIIMQEMPADSGEVIVAKGKTLGYFSSHHQENFPLKKPAHKDKSGSDPLHRYFLPVQMLLSAILHFFPLLPRW